MRITYVALCAAVAAVNASPAEAQTLDPEGELHIPELRTPNRLMIGAGGGLGIIDGTCEECRLLGALSLELNGGWQFHRRIAVLADSWSTVHFLPADGDNPGVTGYWITTLASQVWMTPIVFVRAGLGIGGLWAVSENVNAYDHGPGFSLVVGGELGHRKASGIDLAVRVSGGPSQYSNFGAPWYFSFGVVIGYHRNMPLGPIEPDSAPP